MMLGRILSSLVRNVRSGRAAAGHIGQVQLEALEAHLQAGDLAGAERVLRAAAVSNPQSSVTWQKLGSVLGAQDRLDEARAALERCLEIDPDNVPAWADLGNVHRQSGRFDQAQSCYERALAGDPGNRAAALNLALLLADSGRSDEAIERLAALVSPPAHPEALQAMVRLLDARGEAARARTLCEDVLAREPQMPAAHAALGFLLLKRFFDPERALEHLDRAAAGGLRSEEVLSNIGIAYQDLGRLDDAIAAYDAALAVRPDFHSARFHRALALLMRGEFARAWPDYDARLLGRDAQAAFNDLPPWSGEPLREGKLLVYGEQGLGDEIMFASCLDDLCSRCPDVVLACSAKLGPIFRRSFPVTRVVTLQKAVTDPRPEELCDTVARVAIGSLPRHFRNAREHFPRHGGYLKADPALVQSYRSRLEALGPGLKVGVSWRGGTEISRRALRTLDEASLAALLDFPARFVCLQYDSDGTEPALASLRDRGRLTHWQDALDDYDHTAALVCTLDVVVSVCTAVIHLAGALGVPTLVMTPKVPEWRYGIAGDAMPWYPSVQLIRQQQRGDWESVVGAVHARLAELGNVGSDSNERIAARPSAAAGES